MFRCLLSFLAQHFYCSFVVFELVLFGVFVYPLLGSCLFLSLGVCLHYIDTITLLFRLDSWIDLQLLSANNLEME